MCLYVLGVAWQNAPASQDRVLARPLTALNQADMAMEAQLDAFKDQDKKRKQGGQDKENEEKVGRKKRSTPAAVAATTATTRGQGRNSSREK